MINREMLYGMVRLAAVIVVVAAIFTLVTIQEINSNNHKFCQVVTATTSIPVSKPTDPTHNVSQERNWEWYVRFVNLGHSLGC